MSVGAGIMWRMNAAVYDFVIDRAVVRQQVRVSRSASCVRFECVSNYASCVQELLPGDFSSFVTCLGFAESSDVLSVCRAVVSAGEGASVRRALDRVAQTVSSTY